MFRKATSLLLVILLGLYLPAAGTSVCLCLTGVEEVKAESFDVETDSCCDEQETDAEPCCEDSDCCVVIPAMPDGMEQQLAVTPLPVSLPAPGIFEDPLAAPQAREIDFPTLSPPAPALPPGAPVRIAFGVWRL